MTANRNLIAFYHLVSGSSAPSVVAGTGAGTAPTVSMVGTNSGGELTVTTGSLPAGTNATICTVTFTANAPTDSYVVLFPANAVTALLSGVTMVYASGSNTGFVVVSGTTALTASTTYLWNYVVLTK